MPKRNNKRWKGRVTPAGKPWAAGVQHRGIGKYIFLGYCSTYLEAFLMEEEFKKRHGLRSQYTLLYEALLEEADLRGNSQRTP